MEKQCPSCKSTKIISDLKIPDHDKYTRDLSLEIVTKPDALLFSGTKKHPLIANVCCNCGKVELSVNLINS